MVLYQQIEFSMSQFRSIVHKEPALREQFMDEVRQWKRKAVNAYRRHVERFQELLYRCI